VIVLELVGYTITIFCVISMALVIVFGRDYDRPAAPAPVRCEACRRSIWWCEIEDGEDCRAYVERSRW